MPNLRRFPKLVRATLLVVGITLCTFGGLLGLLEFVIAPLAPYPSIPWNGWGTLPKMELHVRLRDFDVVYKGNSLGLRNEEVGPQQNHKYRICAVGDSYTFGWGVELEQAWVKQLEKNLRARGWDVEVINFGKPGTSPTEYLQAAKMAAKTLEPDLMLFGLLEGNDMLSTFMTPFERYLPNTASMVDNIEAWWNTPREAQPPPQVQDSETHRAYLMQEAQNVLSRMSESDRARYEKLDEDIKTSFLEGRINPWMMGEAVGGGTLFEYALDYRGQASAEFERFSIMMRRIQRACAAYDIPAIAVSVPNGAYDNKHLIAMLQRFGYAVDEKLLFQDGAIDAAREACQEAGIPFGEATEAFRTHADDPGIYFKLDHHWTPKGHALFGEAITPFVEEQLKKVEVE